jgi:hypothetical protein
VSRRACIFAFGATGSGKTFFLRGLLGRVPRLLVVDVTGDYAELERCRTFTRAADVAAAFRVAAGGPCRVRFAADLDRAAFRSYTRGQGRGDELPGAIARMGPAAAAIAFAARDLVLVLDELALWCTPSSTPEPLKLVATMGRHRGVSILAGAQRPALVSRHVTAQRDLVVYFRLEEPIDLDYAKRRLGVAAEGLAHLRVGHAIAAGDPACLEILGVRRLPVNVREIPRVAFSKVRGDNGLDARA